MRSRQKLQSELEGLLGTDHLPAEKRRVYFQPPSGTKIEYPCIIFELSRTDVQPADNSKFIKYNEYHVKHMFKSLKNEIKDKLLDNFHHISHDTRFISNSIYNDEFTLYY